MGLALKQRTTEYIRFTAQVRCECGALATRQVWFIQLNSQGKPMVNMLAVCEDCLHVMLATDSGIVEVR